MKKKLKIISLILLVFFGCNKKNQDYKKYVYQSKIRTNNFEIEATLNWLDENHKVGGIVLEITNDRDSLLYIQKYIFYENKEGILSLSSESKDKIFTYQLNKDDINNLILLPMESSRDSSLFNLNIKSIVFEKQN